MTEILWKKKPIFLNIAIPRIFHIPTCISHCDKTFKWKKKTSNCSVLKFLNGLSEKLKLFLWLWKWINDEHFFFLKKAPYDCIRFLAFEKLGFKRRHKNPQPKHGRCSQPEKRKWNKIQLKNIQTGVIFCHNIKIGKGSLFMTKYATKS